MGPTPDAGNEAVVADLLGKLASLAERVATEMSSEILEVSSLVWSTFRNGGRVFFCGNGGSAADAQHLAAEYVIRFARDRRPLPALALTTDSSILTAGANDLGYRHVFARQVLALSQTGDLLILHSTSGESENLLEATAAARERGVRTVALLAKGGGRLRDMVDLALVIPTDDVARAQEVQLAIGHIVCDLVERSLEVA